MYLLFMPDSFVMGVIYNLLLFIKLPHLSFAGSLFHFYFGKFRILKSFEFLEFEFEFTAKLDRIDKAVYSTFRYTMGKRDLDKAQATNGEVVLDIPTQYGISLPFDSFPLLEEWNEKLDQNKVGLTELEVEKAKKMWNDFVSVNKSIWIRYCTQMLCKCPWKLYFA